MDDAETTDVPEAQPEPSAPTTFVYALGQVDAHYPSLGVEREIAQAPTTVDTEGMNERQRLKAVISDPENSHLARKLCWVLIVQGFETYVLAPRDPKGFDLLVETYHEDPATEGIDVVIGARGGMAPPEFCGGMALPIAAFDQLYSFDRSHFVAQIPAIGITDDARFRTVAGEVFDRIVHMADNAGATDEHRALNYVALRYPPIYAKAAELDDRGAFLRRITAHRSPLSTGRRTVDVVFTYASGDSEVPERQFVRVDVADEQPFLAQPMSTYYEPLGA